MREIGMCLGMIAVLLFLFVLFGRLGSKLAGIQTRGGLGLLFGVFVYFGIFQMAALPMIMMKQPLSRLSAVWMAVVLAAVGIFLTGKQKERKGRGFSKGVSPDGRKQNFDRKAALQEKGRLSLIKIVMLLVVGFQMYYIITSEYLGWDTSFYVGSIATSLARNSMYLYHSETGKPVTELPFRYALSGFYMHSAVWCQVLGIRAIYWAKIVQGGVLAVLSNAAVFELGKFLFSGKSYENLVKKEKVTDCAAAMVIAAVILNVFFDSMYSTSDFLMSRALEAKAYCSNLVLPCIFLYGMMLWRDNQNREAKIWLFTAAFSSVAISMSSLVIAPALLTILFLPVLLRTKTWKTVRLYVLCVLPNLMYLIVYLLFRAGMIKVGV